MNADVTITISTAGSGSVETRGPVPGSAEGIAVDGLAGRVNGPIPLPLDQLPVGGTGGSVTGAAGPGGPPIPMPIETVATGTEGAGGTAPVPMDLDRLATGTAGLPTPQDLEAMAAASDRPAPRRSRSRKASSR
jgi:hypothetical protein